MEYHASGGAAATASAPPTGGRAAQSSSARRRVQACLISISGCACERRVGQPVRWACHALHWACHTLTPPRVWIPTGPGTSTAKGPKVEQRTWVPGARMGPPSLLRALCFHLTLGPALRGFVRTTPIHHHHLCRLAIKFVCRKTVHSNAYRCQG
ncbi:hypothetical protein LZ30DRAFT_461853 [Colletotrichum cereale]|nr:hypothetical protein LZ30DRAFT_461853 [Colletotrichum cereale]